MGERKHNLAELVEERLEARRKQRIEEGREIGADLCADHKKGDLSTQELAEILKEINQGHSGDFARGVWYGYLEKGAEIAKLDGV